MDQWRCPFCHQLAYPVDIHGHVQCSRCGQNVDPCCGGEQACPAMPSAATQTDPLKRQPQ